jgi:hypothetical protein
MAQFTTSAKPIQHYRESALINKFAHAVGDRCERLTQSERYQLITVLSLYCHACCELDDDDEADTPYECYYRYIDVPFSVNVVACLVLFEDEEPDAIASILPALTEYARNEYVDDKAETAKTCEGDPVLSGLSPFLYGVDI